MYALIVGYGRAGKRHHELLKASGLVHSIGVVDSSSEAMGDLHGLTKSFTSIDEALATKPHFALVSTSSGSHLSVSEKITSAGVACLIEKPVAGPNDSLDVLRDAERKGIVVSVVSQHRFAPDVTSLFELLQSGVKATLTIRRMRSVSYIEKAEREGGQIGGVILTIAIHWLDLFVTALGRPTDVLRLDCTYHGSVQIGSIGRLLWGNGTEIMIDAAWGADIDERSDSLNLSAGDGTEYIYVQDCIHGALERCDVSNESLISAQLGNFVDSVRGVDKPRVTLTHAGDALSVAALLA